MLENQAYYIKPEGDYALEALRVAVVASAKQELRRDTVGAATISRSFLVLSPGLFFKPCAFITLTKNKD